MDHDVVASCAPSLTELVTAANAKQHRQSYVSRPGEGPNSNIVRSKKGQNRLKAKSEKVRETLEATRKEKKDRGLFLCDEKCPDTGRYCRKDCLTKEGLEKHKTKASHNFPTMNATDFVVVHGGKVGGVLALGSRPNRRTNDLFEVTSPADEDSSPAIAARCYQCFNRRDVVEATQKTDAQVCFLLRCFGAENKYI